MRPEKCDVLIPWTDISLANEILYEAFAEIFIAHRDKHIRKTDLAGGLKLRPPE